MQVMRASEQHRPRLRRARRSTRRLSTRRWRSSSRWLAWAVSGDAVRFLAVLVVATPCPLAHRHPGRHHRLGVAGGPTRDHHQGPGGAGEDRHLPHRHLRQDRHTHLRPAEADRGDRGTTASATRKCSTQVASLERYSKHPLSAAILDGHANAARGPPRGGRDQRATPGRAAGHRSPARRVQVTSRKKLLAQHPEVAGTRPPLSGGLECVALIDGRYAATLRVPG